MKLQLDGQIAMISAGTRGIGRAVVQSLLEEGVRVSVCGLNEERVLHLQRELGPDHLAMVCDLSNRDSILRWHSETIQKLGDPHLLITNTGGPPAGGVLEVTENQWVQGIESTLFNITRLCDLVLPRMKDAKWGRIVHLTSLVARDPHPLLAISSTLRAGILALTRLQAQALAPYGITVNGVLPGHTDTDRQRHLLEIRALKNASQVESERIRAESEIPLGRFARPEEIASVITFICSIQASYLTGANIQVDGGVGGGL